MFSLLAFLISFHVAHAAPSAAVDVIEAVVDSPEHHRSCARDLLGREAAHPLLLATAVLVRDNEGQLHFAYGSYFFSQHSSLLWQSLEQVDIKEILWMGEIRYELVNGKPMIHEVNETSGYYADNVCSGWACGARPNVPMRNDYLNLPQELLAQGFHGEHYNEKRKHLPAELNVSNRNLRHAIGQSLNAICNIFSYAQAGLHLDPELGLREDIRANEADIELAEQVLSYSLLKRMITHDEVSAILRAIAMFKDSQLTLKEVLEMDTNVLLWQVHALSETSMRLFSLPADQPAP